MRTKVFSFVALAVLLLLASCQKEDYVKAIPADAAVVVSVDFATLAEQSGLNQDNANIQELAKTGPADLAKMMIGEEVCDFLLNPEKMGIDFRVPVYLFAVDGRTYGATMKLYDADKAVAFFTALSNRHLSTKPTKQDGRMSGQLMGDVEYSFDDNSLVLLVSDDGRSKAVLKELLEQDADHSFVSTEAFGRMSSADGVAKMYAAPGQLNLMLPFDLMGQLESLSTLNFTNGKACVKMSVWGKTAKAQQTIDDAYAKLKLLTCEFDDDIPSDFVVWASMGVKGDWLLSKLKEDPATKELLFMLERAIDVEQMIRAIDGDVTYTGTPSIASNFPSGAPESPIGLTDWTVMAEIKNSDFLNDVAYWMQSMRDYNIKMDKVGEWKYRLNADGEELYWGVDNDRDELFFASAGGFNRMRFNHDSDVLDPYESDIERSYLYAYINLQAPWWKSALGLHPEAFQQFAELFKCMTIKSQKVGEVELEVQMNNKRENFLKQAIDAMRLAFTK